MAERKSTKSTKSTTRSKSAKSTTSTAQALTTQANQEIQAPETAGGYLDLPSEISVTVPDFGAMIGGDLGNPESFAIDPLTDAERERDAKIYREKQNRIDNYIDGAKTIGKVVSLGIEISTGLENDLVEPGGHAVALQQGCGGPAVVIGRRFTY